MHAPLIVVYVVCSFCCVYLAFKIDEYVVSMDQFGNVIAPDLRQEVVEYVLSHEVIQPCCIITLTSLHYIISSYCF